MIGLLYIAFFSLYLWLTVYLVKRVARAAKKRSIAGWKWGVPMALVMYLLVFWDWIPTVVAHNYYCSEYGGFTVHKTLDEWKEENPGVAETLVSMKGATSISTEIQVRYELNQRFSWDIIKSKGSIGIEERDNQIVDKETNEMLVRFVDFSTGIRGIIGPGERTLRDSKVWMSRMLCEPKAESKIKFNQFVSSIELLGE